MPLVRSTHSCEANRYGASRERSRGPRVVVLSSSLLTDRMLLYSGFVDRLHAADAKSCIWATSAESCPEVWSECQFGVRPFPTVEPYKEFPYNLIRRANDYAWDYRLRLPARMSMMRHVRSKRRSALDRLGSLIGRAVAAAGVEHWFESRVEDALLRYPRCPEAGPLLAASDADVLVTTNPFWFSEPAVAAAAKRRGLRTLAMIPSWDNVTTKARMVFKYDGFLVWSEATRDELHQCYRQSRNVPVYVVGAPQFDVFSDSRFYVPRAEFLGALGLAAGRPLIVYAVGSPNFLKEHHGALDFARRVARGELGDVQVIVRPHPIHDTAQMEALFAEFGPRVVLQKTRSAELAVVRRSQTQDEIREWVNTFRHADVVVNLSSTVTIDAAFFDRPVVNLDFDPEPGQPNLALVKDINHVWTHFKPIAESGGVWLAADMDEVVQAVTTYLERPELHRDRRRWLAEHVCGFVDGRCGQRMAEAILDFADRRCAVAKPATARSEVA